MRAQFKLLLFFASILVLFSSSALCSKEIAFYVSPSGNDSWSGALPAPNDGKGDGPFATFEKARDAIRAIKHSRHYQDQSFTVYVRGGVYFRTNSLELTSEDSGTKEAPVIWRSYLNEEVRINGGRKISDFKPVTDPSILKRINPEYQNKIVQADLKSQGINDLGELKPSGFGFPVAPLAPELSFNDKPMTLARYPNDGWLKITDVPQTGDTVKQIEGGVPTLPRRPPGWHYGRFCYDSDRPARWADLNDI